MNLGSGSITGGIAGMAVIALLSGCSRASLLGGPGPEGAHHASPAEIERLAVLEPGKKFDTPDECRQQLIALAHASSPEQLIQISKLEVRAYHTSGEGPSAVHHEYACLGKQLMARSWIGKPTSLPAPHGPNQHAAEAH